MLAAPINPVRIPRRRTGPACSTASHRLPSSPRDPPAHRQPSGRHQHGAGRVPEEAGAAGRRRDRGGRGDAGHRCGDPEPLDRVILPPPARVPGAPISSSTNPSCSPCPSSRSSWWVPATRRLTRAWPRRPRLTPRRPFAPAQAGTLAVNPCTASDCSPTWWARAGRRGGAEREQLRGRAGCDPDSPGPGAPHRQPHPGRG